MKQLEWRNVFNCEKVYPKPFHECQEIAKSVGYSYICFNGFVYTVNAKTPDDYLSSDHYLI